MERLVRPVDSKCALVHWHDPRPSSRPCCMAISLRPNHRRKVMPPELGRSACLMATLYRPITCCIYCMVTTTDSRLPTARTHSTPWLRETPSSTASSSWRKSTTACPACVRGPVRRLATAGASVNHTSRSCARVEPQNTSQCWHGFATISVMKQLFFKSSGTWSRCTNLAKTRKTPFHTICCQGRCEVRCGAAAPAARALG